MNATNKNMNRKHFFKKSGCLFLIAVLIFSLCACDSSDYKKAMELYDAEEYDEAIVMFEKLDDYKDSAEMVLKCKYEMAQKAIEDGDFTTAEEIFTELGDYEDSEQQLKALPWKSVYAYLKEQGSVEIKNPDPEYTVTLSTSGDNLVASYLIDLDGVYMYCAVTLTEDGSANELKASGAVSFMGAYMADEASTIWDTNSYKKGDSVTWSEYSCSGKKVDGSDLDSGTTGLCNDPTVTLERLTDGIKQLLDGSGLNVTMADIGFGSY